MSAGHRSAMQAPRDSDLAGAEAAMLRAARRAQRRAEEVARLADSSAASPKKAREAHAAEAGHDPRAISFSQAQGYEQIPGLLKLEELPSEARVRIWNEFYLSLRNSLDRRRRRIIKPWAVILAEKHLHHDVNSADEFNLDFGVICDEFRRSVETIPFNRVFDLIQFVLRNSSCPPDFAARMKSVFFRCRLAYAIDEGKPPTIVPTVTPEEGEAVVGALRTMREAGFGGAASHLRHASECINAGDWSGSVRESVHAVESVARQLDPDSRTLGPALISLEERGALHPALEAAFNKLYGYTSDEQGIRHAMLDPVDSSVGRDEAVFMLGACASFASYIWRKHKAEEAN